MHCTDQRLWSQKHLGLTLDLALLDHGWELPPISSSAKMGIIIEPTSKAVLRIEDMHVKPLEEPWYWLTL